MLNETLDKLIQEEISKGIDEYKQNYEFIKEQLIKYKNEFNNAKQELDQLKRLNKQIKYFESFQALINEENIEELIYHLNLNKTKIDITGMDSDKIPIWFKLLCTYYQDKEKLFLLLDMFNIEYPIWAKKFKMPFDYDEEELDLIFEHIGKMYVCNGQIFSGNIGFFYTYQNRYKGDLNLLISRESYAEIPWNLLLQNPLLTTDEYFFKIINVLKGRASHSEYFFMIQNYQELTESQVDMLAKYIPTTYLYSYHTNFLSKNKGIFKKRIDLAELFIDKIKNNKYSEFHYLNYPIEMQKEFVVKESDKYNRFGFELVDQMEITNEEKITLLSEIARNLLSKKQ